MSSDRVDPADRCGRSKKAGRPIVVVRTASSVVRSGYAMDTSRPLRGGLVPVERPGTDHRHLAEAPGRHAAADAPERRPAGGPAPVAMSCRGQLSTPGRSQDSSVRYRPTWPTLLGRSPAYLSCGAPPAGRSTVRSRRQQRSLTPFKGIFRPQRSAGHRGAWCAERPPLARGAAGPDHAAKSRLRSLENLASSSLKHTLPANSLTPNASVNFRRHR